MDRQGCAILSEDAVCGPVFSTAFRAVFIDGKDMVFVSPSGSNLKLIKSLSSSSVAA
jgi:hypothetical protein